MGSEQGDFAIFITTGKKGGTLGVPKIRRLTFYGKETELTVWDLVFP